MRDKIKGLRELTEIAQGLQAQGRVVVMANGCFDILHVGHIRYLTEAKALGDILVVGLNSDRSVRELKGPGRPVSGQDERAEILSALRVVDYVVIFDEPNVENLIKALQPQIHAKGTDYTEESVPEAAVVRAYGGRVAITGDAKGHSCTQIITHIRQTP